MTQATLHIRTQEGQERLVRATAGENLMHVLRDHGFPIAAICGGCLSCATCHIHVDPASYGRLTAPTEAELDLLACEPSYEDGASRLACQIEISTAHDGLILTLVPDA